MRVETWKGRQESGVDVEHAPLPMQHKVRGEQPHEATEADQFDAVLVDRMLQHALECRTILAVWPVINHQGCNTSFACELKPRRIGSVGNDKRNLGRIVLGLRCLDQGGLQVLVALLGNRSSLLFTCGALLSSA